MVPVTTTPTLLARIDLRGVELTAARLRAALPRGGVDVESVLPKVRPIVEAVAEHGAAAALTYGETFDGVRPAAVRVPDSALEAAVTGLDRDVRDALQVMIERTRRVHADQRRTDTTTTLDSGATVTERWVPVGTRGPVRARRKRGVSVQCGDECGARPGGRCRLAGGRQPAAEGLWRAPASDHSGRGAHVGCRRGLGGRRCTSGGVAGLRGHRHGRGGAGAGRHDHRSRQHLRHRRQTAVPLRGRHRRRSRAH